VHLSPTDLSQVALVAAQQLVGKHPAAFLHVQEGGGQPITIELPSAAISLQTEQS